MHEKYDSLVKNDTGELTKLREDKVLINSKWVYKSKFNFNRSIDKFKARLVEKGHSQKGRIDYEDTFAPVIKMNTIKLIISLVTKHISDLYHMDFKSTFLNDELKEHVYLFL